MPGEYILETAEGTEPVREEVPSRDFRQAVREEMQDDGVTLLYENAMSRGVFLPLGEMIKTALRILNNEWLYSRREDRTKITRTKHIQAEAIYKAYSPQTVEKYGARNRLASALSVLVANPSRYVHEQASLRNMSPQQETQFRESIALAQHPLKSRSGDVLAMPYVVWAGCTRRREEQMAAPIYIAGYGGFGEFAEVSLEIVTASLINELNRGEVESKVTPSSSDVFVHLDGKDVVGVLREYEETSIGTRNNRWETRLIHPKNDCGLDLKLIEEEARERYNIARE